SPLLSLSSHVPAPTQIYTLSLHDALPISGITSVGVSASSAPPSFDACASSPSAGSSPASPEAAREPSPRPRRRSRRLRRRLRSPDRKSTRLNSSHVKISYAVFCLKKKK